MIEVWPEVFEVLQERCLRAGNIGLTEYANRALAKVLNIVVRGRRGKHPYYKGGILNTIEATESLFSILDLTPLGLPVRKDLKKEEGDTPGKPSETAS